MTLWPTFNRKASFPQVKLLKEYKHTSPLVSCRIDPTGQYAFMGAQDNTIQRLDLATGEKSPFAGHKSWVRALAFREGAAGTAFFSGGYDGQVLTWECAAAAPNPFRSTPAHKGWVRALAVSPDGDLLASCGNDNLVKTWGTGDGKLLKEFTGHTSHVYNVAFHPTKPFLVSGDHRGILKQWDLATGSLVRDLDAAVLHKYDESFRAHIGGVRSMAFNADGSLLACAGITDVTNAFAGVGKPVIALFDWETGKQKHLLRPKEEFQGTMWGVDFLADGTIVGAAGGSGGTLWLWQPDQPQAFFTFKLPNNVRDLAVHPDGKTLAIAFADGTLRTYAIAVKAPA